MTGGILAFLERTGGVLGSPRATLRALAANDDARLGDVAVLMGLRLIAGQTPVQSTSGDSPVLLAQALLWLPSGEFLAAIQGLLHAASKLLPDVVAVLVASVALALFAGRKTAGRELDLAGYAWLPFLAVHTAAALLWSALGRPMSHGETLAVDGVAVAWSVAVWVMALVAVRTTPAPTREIG